MIRRIDTILRLRRSVPKQKSSIKRDLERAGLTEDGVYRLAGRLERLYEDESNLKRFETWYRDLGDSWAKDDWPHAIHARAPAVGALFVAVN